MIATLLFIIIPAHPDLDRFILLLATLIAPGDLINQYGTENAGSTKRPLTLSIAVDRRRSAPVRWRDPQNPWDGWRFVGDELIDTGGNRYGQDEIRALFYNRRRMRSLEETVNALRPPPPAPEPIQLTLDLAPFWKTHATR